MSESQILEFKERFSLNSHDCESLFLDHGYIPSKYRRNNFLATHQKKLFESNIVIAGCGATGQAYAALFARLGLGNITLIDHDTFEFSNLNRQSFCFENNLGKLKVLETKKEIGNINSAVNVKAFPKKIEDCNLEDLLKHADIIIDALDNIDSRLFLEDVCSKANKPYIHSGISGWCGQIKLVWPRDNFLKTSFTDKHSKVAKYNPTLSFTVSTLAGIVGSAAVKYLLGTLKQNNNFFCFFDLERAEFIFEKVPDE